MTKLSITFDIEPRNHLKKECNGDVSKLSVVYSDIVTLINFTSHMARYYFWKIEYSNYEIPNV
jgi:hypothetical protein